jgi:hypothetical protein
MPGVGEVLPLDHGIWTGQRVNPATANREEISHIYVASKILYASGRLWQAEQVL